MARRPLKSAQLSKAVQTAIETGRFYEFLSAGIHACIDNACSLCDDCMVLIRNQRYAAAQSACATTFEEIGKALILYDIVRANARKSDAYEQLAGCFQKASPRSTAATNSTHPDAPP